jgi:hypothetical protein
MGVACFADNGNVIISGGAFPYGYAQGPGDFGALGCPCPGDAVRGDGYLAGLALKNSVFADGGKFAVPKGYAGDVFIYGKLVCPGLIRNISGTDSVC